MKRAAYLFDILVTTKLSSFAVGIGVEGKSERQAYIEAFYEAAGMGKIVEIKLRGKKAVSK